MSDFSVQYVGGLRTRMVHKASGTQVETDAPVDNHGLGQVFSPTDLVASAVASCMMTIVGIRCTDWGIPEPAMSAEVRKVMLDGPRRIGEVHVDLRVALAPEVDTEAYRTRVRRVAETCPVAESLHADCKIVLNLEWGGA